MQKMVSKKWVFIFICIVFLPGCILLNSSSVEVHPGKNYHTLDHDSYAVLPFTDIRPNQHDKRGFDAERIMTDSFETALMKTGAKIVERNKINTVLKQMRFEYEGHVDEAQLQEIGKMTNSNAVVLGMIRTFASAQFNNKAKPDKPTKCTTISFSVKAINIRTGEILWKGCLTKSPSWTTDILCKCDTDLIQYADKVANDMVQNIIRVTEKKEP